jgi:hypothetical protein
MRVLLPQMYDGDHSYAVDVTKVDAAFGAISRVLNGGLDESNFVTGLKFANESIPGDVSYAFAAPFSRIVLRGQMTGTPTISTLAMGTLPVGCSLGMSLWVSAFTWLTEADAPTVTFKVGSTVLYTGTMKRIGDVTGRYIMVTTRKRGTDPDSFEFTDSGKPIWVTETVERWIADGNKYELSDVSVLPMAGKDALEQGGLVTVEVSGASLNKPSAFEIAFAARQVA